MTHRPNDDDTKDDGAKEANKSDSKHPHDLGESPEDHKSVLRSNYKAIPQKKKAAAKPRLGRPPFTARQVIQRIKESLPGPVHESLLKTSINTLCDIAQTNRSMIKRLRKRARKGQPLIPDKIEIDRAEKHRRVIRNYLGGRKTKQQLDHIAAYYMRKRAEEKAERVYTPQSYRLTAFSPPADQTLDQYLDDPSLPISPHDREAKQGWIIDQLQKQEQENRDMPKKRRKKKDSSDLSKLPLAGPTKPERIYISKVPPQRESDAKEPEPYVPPPFPPEIAPKAGTLSRPTPSLPGSTPAESTTEYVPPPPPPGYKPPEPPPPITGDTSGMPLASLFPSHSIPVEEWLRNPARWRLLGPDLINRLLPPNDQLRAWYGNLPGKLSNLETIDRIHLLATHPSTIAFAVHPKRKLRQCLHFHVLSKAGGHEEIFQKLGNGSCQPIYERSSAWKYLNYIDRNAIKVHRASGLRFGPAAPPEFHSRHPTHLDVNAGLYQVPKRDWMHAGPDIINRAFASKEDLRIWRAEPTYQPCAVRQAKLLCDLRKSYDILVTAFRAASESTLSHAMVLSLNTGPAQELFNTYGVGNMAEPDCKPWNLLCLWDKPIYHNHIEGALYFGPAMGWTFKECNLPRMIKLFSRIP